MANTIYNDLKRMLVHSMKRSHGLAWNPQKRRTSKFVDEERGMSNWRKHQQKHLNVGDG